MNQPFEAFKMFQFSRKWSESKRGIVWLLEVVSTSACFPAGAYVPEGLMTSCSWDYMTFTPSVRSYTMLLFTFVFFIPLFIIIFCYCRIFRAIRHTTRLVHARFSLLLLVQSTSQILSQSYTMIKTSIRVVVCLFCFFVLSLLCTKTSQKQTSGPYQVLAVGKYSVSMWHITPCCYHLT